MKKLRNIGVCAHIDAGKTTLTERILYYTGKNHKIGEVHDGEATMDWMDQEKERGITINSAATFVYWRGIFDKLKVCKINIIDTPGHVDFTAEVERSMRVLDGACIVFCAVAGVQAQSETVWNQMNRYNIPRIIFINKMDRLGANYNKVCNKIKKKFKIKIIKITYPIFKNEKFVGVIDVLKLKSYFFDENTQGSKITEKNLNKKLKNKFFIKRNKIIETVIEPYNCYIEKYLENKINKKDILRILKKRIKKLEIFPILCGSAYKNKGVQNLLDYIVKLLPSPFKKKVFYINSKRKKKPISNKYFSAFVFKTINDSFSGKLSYVRVYSGILTVGDTVFNSSDKSKNKISRILQVHSNYRQDINKIELGDIAALVGLKNTKTGDTLYREKFVSFEKICFPNPVISFSISPLDDSLQEKMIYSLKKLSIEDQTIHLSTDPESGKVLISGMGELHIDVFLERLKREYNIKVNKSNPKVSYKETITKSSKLIEGKYIRQSGGRGQYGHVVINIYPRKIDSGIKFVNLIKGGIIPKDYFKTIEKSIFDSLKRGVLLGYPVVDIKIELVNGSFHEVDSSENAFSIAASIALKTALKASDPTLLEPIMKVEILSPSKYVGSIIADISAKEGEIFYNKNKNNFSTIKCYVSMKKMFEYSTYLRSCTKGRGGYTMEFAFYKKINYKRI
ncbi:elongation factor G [Candidatus Vidania fulgoroideorum]